MKALLRRLFAGPSEADPAAAGQYGGDAAPARERAIRPGRVTVDGNTHTFWARGEESATTIVEVDAVAGRRQPTGPGNGAGEPPGEPRPRGNPAFSETLFIELMRAGQFARAYSHISPDCQRLWGSVETFATAHDGGALRNVQGVSVRDVRYLDRWTDPDTDVAHRNVAELVVEYTLGAGTPGGGRPVTRLERTVHLVPFEGRWRSLCAPPPR